jgi:hypothetical protein
MFMTSLMYIIGEHRDPHNLRSNTALDIFPSRRTGAPQPNHSELTLVVHEFATISTFAP